MAVKLIFLSSLLTLCISSSMARSVGHAHSFQHFLGPVQGEEKEVTWTDQHGKKHQVYSAPAHYEFAYGVEDHDTGDYHGQKEQRDGKAVIGEYTIKEPDGNIRIVKYRADEDGFHATVLNSNRNDQPNANGIANDDAEGSNYHNDEDVSDTSDVSQL
ncbi:hypothetical protein TKK_0008051 [Trichogramma kaykai]